MASKSKTSSSKVNSDEFPDQNKVLYNTSDEMQELQQSRANFSTIEAKNRKIQESRSNVHRRKPSGQEDPEFGPDQSHLLPFSKSSTPVEQETNGQEGQSAAGQEEDTQSTMQSKVSAVADKESAPQEEAPLEKPPSLVQNPSKVKSQSQTKAASNANVNATASSGSLNNQILGRISALEEIFRKESEFNAENYINLEQAFITLQVYVKDMSERLHNLENFSSEDHDKHEALKLDIRLDTIEVKVNALEEDQQKLYAENFKEDEKIVIDASKRNIEIEKRKRSSAVSGGAGQEKRGSKSQANDAYKGCCTCRNGNITLPHKGLPLTRNWPHGFERFSGNDPTCCKRSKRKKCCSKNYSMYYDPTVGVYFNSRGELLNKGKAGNYEQFSPNFENKNKPGGGGGGIDANNNENTYKMNSIKSLANFVNALANNPEIQQNSQISNYSEQSGNGSQISNASSKQGSKISGANISSSRPFIPSNTSGTGEREIPKQNSGSVSKGGGTSLSQTYNNSKGRISGTGGGTSGYQVGGQNENPDTNKFYYYPSSSDSFGGKDAAAGNTSRITYPQQDREYNRPMGPLTQRDYSTIAETEKSKSDHIQHTHLNTPSGAGPAGVTHLSKVKLENTSDHHLVDTHHILD